MVSLDRETKILPCTREAKWKMVRDTRDLSKVNSFRVLAKLWNEGTMVAMAEICQVSRPNSEVPKTLKIWTLLPGPASGPGLCDRSLTLIIPKVVFSRLGLK